MIGGVPAWLPYVVVPAAASLLGGAFAIVRGAGPRARAGIQLFTAGVIVAAVAGELLPQLSGERPLVVAAGFGAGVAAMFALKVGVERIEARRANAAGAPIALVLVLGVDTIMDGILLGVAFSAGAEEGLVLGVALTLEALFLSLSATTEAEGRGASRRTIAAIACGLALLLALSAIVGVAVFSNLPAGPFHALVAFGVAALLYSVVEELVVEAHEETEPPLVAAMFFLGFLLVLLLELA